MQFTETGLAGAWVIDLKRIEDERGFFAYMFCAKEAAKQGIATTTSQVKLSYNRNRGTLRGMHLQIRPAAESKLVRCIRGSVWDVIVDLREESPTYLQHFGVELSADNHRALYVPQMFAHGYQTLEDGSEVMYQVDEFYAPQFERGLRYDDPRLEIRWPMEVTAMSPRDERWPLLGAPGSMREGALP
jgi:dTDP-4-dehydrorhamnose 3,5-epimerase